LQREKAFTGLGAEQMFPEEATNLRKDGSPTGYPLQQRKKTLSNRLTFSLSQKH
jgi:hypothetical protein